MATADYVAPEMTLAQIEAAIGVGTNLDITDATDLSLIDQAITMVGQAAATWRGKPWWWQLGTGHFQTATKTVETAANDGGRRTSNVSTMTTTAVHGLQAGQTVKITGVSDATFNGTWLIASVPTTSTLTFSQVGDDVAAATAGDGTVAVISYPLRTIDVTGAVTATAANQVTPRFWAIRRIFYDDERTITPIMWPRFRRHLRLLETATNSQPLEYAISGDAPLLYLWPVPDDAYDIFLDMVCRHSKITKAGSTNAALIIPAEFHWALYVQGAEWLLNHANMASASLAECPAFAEGIRRMADADPTQYDDNNPADLYPDARGGNLPGNRKVLMLSDGYLIGGDLTI